jgi:peroxiredoxin Q/BCP
MRAASVASLVVILATGVVVAQGAPQGAPAPTLKVGDLAPDFSLPGTDGKTHRLSDYRGKTAVVIAWFPRAFTGGCTIECKSLADNGDKIKKYEVVYFMASTDSL